MNTVFFIIVMVIIISLLILVVSSPIEKNQTKELLDEANPSNITISPDYVGGLETVLEKTKCSLILMKDKINVRIAFKAVDIMIPFHQIINIEMIKKYQLKESNTISKLFNERSIYINKKDADKEYIAITYFNSEKESEQILIFEFTSSELFIDKYKNLFRKWSEEQYNNDELSIGKACAVDF